MKVQYKAKAKRVLTKSEIVKATPKEALFYIDKKDCITFTTQFGDRYDFTSKVFKEYSMKKIFKVDSNTTDLLFTNIFIEGLPYFYEVVTLSNKELTEDFLRLNTEFNVRGVDGRLYTNDVISNYEVSDGTFIYSVPVVSDSNFTVKFNNRCISVAIPKKEGEVFAVRPRTDVVCTPRVVSQSKIYLPSFYVENVDGLVKCIEGDIRLVLKRELLNVEFNKVTPKSLVSSYRGPLFFQPFTNTFYTSDAFFTETEKIVDYVSKKSSHLFDIELKLFLKVTREGIFPCDKEEADLIVEKEVDLNKVFIITNDTLQGTLKTFKPSSYGFIFKDIEEAYKKAFTSFKKIDKLEDPSKVIYLKNKSECIYQSTYNEPPKRVVLKNSKPTQLLVDNSWRRLRVGRTYYGED